MSVCFQLNLFLMLMNADEYHVRASVEILVRSLRAEGDLRGVADLPLGRDFDDFDRKSDANRLTRVQLSQRDACFRVSRVEMFAVYHHAAMLEVNPLMQFVR